MHFPRILITTDFSEPSFAAFALAAYTEQMEGSELILLNVRQYSPPFLEIDSTPNQAILEAYREEYRGLAKKKLDELAAKYFHNQKVRTEVLVSMSAVGDEVCRFAEKEDCSLILMGSRGFSKLGSIFVGSTVQRVLQHATCPVLVVPPVDKEKKK